MKAYSLLRAAGSAIWIGGQLFAVVALPVAAGTLPRRKDRRRVVEAGWQAWTPIAFAAAGATLLGTFVETRVLLGDERRRARVRFAAALGALAGTGAATAIGRMLARRQPPEDTPYPVDRDASGLPVARVPGRRALKLGMIPVNAFNALASAGLLIAAA